MPILGRCWEINLTKPNLLFFTVFYIFYIGVIKIVKKCKFNLTKSNLRFSGAGVKTIKQFKQKLNSCKTLLKPLQIILYILTHTYTQQEALRKPLKVRKGGVLFSLSISYLSISKIHIILSLIIILIDIFFSLISIISI